MQVRMSLSAAAAAALAGGSGSASSGSNEVAAKRAELQKLEELEGKISVELQALREQLAGLKSEVDTYVDVEGANRSKEEAREQLERQQQDLQTQQESLKVRGALQQLHAPLADFDSSGIGHCWHHQGGRTYCCTGGVTDPDMPEHSICCQCLNAAFAANGVKAQGSS
jgi:TolA-binding protein